MTECYQTPINFPSVKRRKVEADFSGGDITSNAGIPLLAQVDERLGLTRAIARALDDPRRQASCEHTLPERLMQRIYGLALGLEDLNDHQELRHELYWFGLNLAPRLEKVRVTGFDEGDET